MELEWKRDFEELGASEMALVSEADKISVMQAAKLAVSLYRAGNSVPIWLHNGLLKSEIPHESTIGVPIALYQFIVATRERL